MVSTHLAPDTIYFLLSALIRVKQFLFIAWMGLICHLLLKVRQCNSQKLYIIQHYCNVSITFNEMGTDWNILVSQV